LLLIVKQSYSLPTLGPSWNWEIFDGLTINSTYAADRFLAARILLEISSSGRGGGFGGRIVAGCVCAIHRYRKDRERSDHRNQPPGGTAMKLRRSLSSYIFLHG